DHHTVPRQARREPEEGDGLSPVAAKVSIQGVKPMPTISRRAFGALSFAALGAAAAGPAMAQDLENTLYLDLTYGRVVIQLRPDKAPVTVARIKELARQGFYDGTPFHRVIPGFMAQGGDP